MWKQQQVVWFLMGYYSNQLEKHSKGADLNQAAHFPHILWLTPVVCIFRQY